MRRLTSITAVTATALVAACTASGPGGSDPGPTDRAPRPGPGGGIELVALRTADDCDALGDHLRAEAEARVGPFGLTAGHPPMLRGPAVAEDADLAAPDAAEPAPGPGEAARSGTNVQEAGVDEPDLIKSDGRRIVTLSNGQLTVVDLTGPEPRVASRTPMRNDHANPSELLLAGDGLLVLGHAWAPTEPEPPPTGDAATPRPASSDAVDPWWPGGRSRATVTLVDLADPDRPVVGDTLSVDGHIVSARLAGGLARVVVSSAPDGLGFVRPNGPGAEQVALEANREVIRRSALEDWLPSMRLTGPDGSLRAEGLVAECSRVHLPGEFAGFGTLSVLTFDPEGSLGTGEAVSVVASGSTVYASAERLYVAMTAYDAEVPAGSDARVLPVPSPDPAAAAHTAIHAFVVDRPGPATYLASGTVPGALLGQFAMGEHEGRLRVATTTGQMWGAGAGSESRVTVLEPDGDRLVTIGEVTGLGPTERIYAVRYVGDLAYVVTFRETDPLYVVDLSDPTAPRVAGQLEVPGYSAYLHPIGEGLLVGVGQEADERGRPLGAKVSLFDVGDPASPAELATWIVPGGSSIVESDHRAFLWWGPQRLLALPVSDWRGGFSGVVLLEVDRAGIGEVGRIDHAEERPAGADATDCEAIPEEAVSGSGFEEAVALLARGMLVLVCGPEDAGGALGHVCDSYDGAILGEMGVGGDDRTLLPEGGRIEVCFPAGPRPDPVIRSMVVGADLWTMSWSRLQANDLDGLGERATLAIG